MEQAKAVLEIAMEISNCWIIPMPDYKPKYPKIYPEAEINPNHPTNPLDWCPCSCQRT
jgi:hypothetical protein